MKSSLFTSKLHCSLTLPKSPQNAINEINAMLYNFIIVSILMNGIEYSKIPTFELAVLLKLCFLLSYSENV